jgi:glycogen operon protein
MLKKSGLFFILSMIAALMVGCSNPDAGKTQDSATPADNTPPSFSADYPKMSDISVNKADVLVKVNESGKLYVMAVPANSEAPSAFQIKLQMNYGNVTVVKSVMTQIVSGVELPVTIDGLSQYTDYDVYFAVEDAYINLIKEPAKLSFTTDGLDITPPAWTAGYPSVINIAMTSFELKAKINESGKAYYVVVADNAAAPTAAQVKNPGSYGSAIKSGSIDLTAEIEGKSSVTGLNADTNYDIYLAGEDSMPNLMTSPVKLEAKTTNILDTTPPSWSSSYPAVSNATVNAFDLSFKVNESGKVYYLVVLKSAAAPTPAQVKNPAAYGGSIVKSDASSIFSDTELKISVSGLIKNTDYDIYMVAEDNVPNLMTAVSKLSVKTLQGDIIPPAEVSGLKAVAGNQKVTLTWTDPADADFEKITITYNSQTIEVLKGIQTKEITGLTNEVKYDFTVKTSDFSANYSAGVPVSSTPSAVIPYLPVEEAKWGTSTWGLGAKINTEGDLEVGLFSANATRVVLEIYMQAYGADAEYSYVMAKGSDNIWRAKISKIPQFTLYAFRLWGPNWPYNASWKKGTATGFISDKDASGNVFNPNKVVYDPYARELTHDDECEALYAEGLDAKVYATGSKFNTKLMKVYREIDSGKYSPKGIVFNDTTGFGTKPQIAKKDAMIYEAHVRGLTMSDSATSIATILSGMSEFDGIENIPADERGTYAGAAKMAKYIKGLGFNTIQLMPVHECNVNDINDFEPNKSKITGFENYWGYMTANFFSPDRRYAKDKSPGGPTREFKQMVKAFHDAGIEVYLDVVYNHTGEGGVWQDGTTLKINTFRGIDNTAYYQLINSELAYQNDSGCGNNFAAASSTVAKQLVMDSLAYWTDVMGVDGFRYDLATILGRESKNAKGWYDFNGNADLLNKINTFASNKNVEMIAEAWDAGTYQLTNFPGNWSDWNGKFRDEVRKSITDGAWGKIGDIMQGTTYYGYSSTFPESVNFVTAHDGLTMMDLLSYNNDGYTSSQKVSPDGITYYANATNMALAWPFGPSDGGSSDNTCSDMGGNKTLRRQHLRNYWTIEFFSKGIPMALYGDEFGRTQNGNNNAYNVDSPATWNNYAMINTDSPNKVSIPGGTYHDNFGTDSNADGKNALFIFVSNLIKVRRDNPSLRDYAVPFGNWKSASGDSTWSTTGSFTIDGGANGNFLVMVNMSSSDMTFPVTGSGWKRIIETASWAEANNNYWPLASAWVCSQSTYTVKGKSITIFQK